MQDMPTAARPAASAPSALAALPAPSRYRLEDGVPCIDVSATNIERLLDNRDPAPFRERDLDPGLATYLIDAVEDLASSPRVRVVFWLQEPCAASEIEDSYRAHFGASLQRIVRQNHQRVRLGLSALVIAVVILVALFALSQLMRATLTGSIGAALSEGVTILSWIVLWRPTEVLLYDWIPVRRERRLVRLLLDASLAVRVGQPGSSG